MTGVRLAGVHGPGVHPIFGAVDGRPAGRSGGYDSAVPREYDAQLIESVAVRRVRMRDSLLWGRQRRALATGDNLRWFRIGVVLAALACAACVGWSFVQGVLLEKRAQAPAAIWAVPR